MSDPFELIKARYGAKSRPAFGAPDAFNPVLETLLSHRSVRAFLPDTLDAGTLELLVSAAQSAPSSSNLQVWSLVAVEEPARRERIAAFAGGQKHVREAPLFLAWLVDLARLQQVAAKLGQPVEGIHYLDTFLMGVIDAALAAQNVVSAAESLGLGTVYIGALRNRPEEVAAELQLPPGVFPAFGLCIGHPDPAQPAAVKPRLPQSAVLHRERYDATANPEAVAQYDDIMKAFYVSQNLGPTSWSAHSVARLAGPDSLRGRERLKDALAAQGFELR